jgi:minor extracellular serine protease Vpr
MNYIEENHMKFPYRVLLVLCILGVVAVAFGGTLSTKQLATLHPAFQSVIAKAHPELGLTPSTLQKVTEAEGVEGTGMYGAIITTNDPELLRMAGVTVRSIYPTFVTATVTADQLLTIADLPSVAYIDPGSENYPTNDVSVPETGARLVQDGYFNTTPHQGEGAIVVVYDTGIDWKHKDFRSPVDTTKTRILAIWDQTLTPGAGESSPSAPLNYGVEYTQDQINAELAGSTSGFVREKDTNGHGTHVMATAAGNGLALGRHGGMAPKADLIVIKGGNTSFGETSMIDGLSYAAAKATQYGKPVSFNWSIGGQSGPHDGTRSYEAAVDNFVSTPGRVVAISAGNEGASRIHVSGTAGASTTITFIVPAFTATAGTGNDVFGFDFWLDGQPATTATITSPHGYTATAAVGQTGTGNNGTDGSITLYHYNSLSGNDAQYVQVYVSDDGGVPPATGTWTLTVTNPGTATPYDGWIWRSTVGAASVTLVGGDTLKTVASPGTSNGAITAASYVTRWSWPSYNGSQYLYSGSDRTANLSSFSSIGPTRDGRMKPDLAAPGQGIASALSSTADTAGQSVWVLPGQKHWLMQGTSMAAPHITGAAALILGAYPTATASEIKSLLTSTANSDGLTGLLPNYSWGYGKLDVAEAFARKINPSATLMRSQIAYDGTSANTTAWITGGVKLAVRCSPSVSGQLTGVTIMPTTPNNRPIRGTGDVQVAVYSNAGGLPGTQIGSTVTVPLANFVPGTAGYVNMIGAGVNVTSGTDFHVVVSAPGVGDSLLIRTENVSGTHSSNYNGSSWAAATTNHRIRAIVTTATGVNSVNGGQNGPLTYDLGQNYPNPFNPTTQIAYTVAERGKVSLKVFDVLGRQVSTIFDGEQEAGSYRVTWNGRNANNLPVTSGVYFYRLESGNFSQTKKMVVLK